MGQGRCFISRFDRQSHELFLELSQLPSLGDPRLFEKAVAHLKDADSTLASVIKKHGTIEFSPEGEMFESLVESIIGQQLAGSAASAIISRLRALYGGKLEPRSLYSTRASSLRRVGVSPQKIRYLKDLTSRVVKGKLNLELLRTRPDMELLEELDKVLGIGPWTIHMVLIFTLGRPDVLPVDDLGIRKSIQNLYSLRKLPDRDRIEKLALPWHPYCSVASLYLWKSQDSQS
jgi:DNA-3-methyladenine glycosylase II